MATPSFCSKTHAKQFNEASLNPLSICLSRFNASFIKPKKKKKKIYFSFEFILSLVQSPFVSLLHLYQIYQH